MDMSSTAATSALGGNAGEALSSSAIVAEAVTGSHVLKIEGYSLIKGHGNGEFVRSSTFGACGHHWYIRYYPDGDRSDTADWISLFLQHDPTVAVDVNARFKFNVLDLIGEPVSLFIRHEGSSKTFCGKNRCWGYDKFVQRKDLEESAYLKDDILRIRCDITVIKDIRMTEAHEQFVVVPPSNMIQQFGRLLQDGKGVDVTFQVAGEKFAAHRCVLAARSPVFMAELFGPMKEKTMSYIRIDDMDARVFKAMLQFIYTDTMADIDKEDDALVITQHLLVAADRYDLERLKLICEDNLCKYIDASTVATTLALSEQHCCHGLKKACFDFLKTPSNLQAAMANESFDHLFNSCPSVIKVLLTKGAACP
ncbi:unnamed protein product [Urochloa decumbens]|uniref:Uncharacterized protein n=1 Tax=Urochloa decumbens TaxID=240449 RepID=A0ABC9AUC9_9POAL